MTPGKEILVLMFTNPADTNWEFLWASLTPWKEMQSANTQTKPAREKDKGGKKQKPENIQTSVNDSDVASMPDFSVNFIYSTSFLGLCTFVCLQLKQSFNFFETTMWQVVLRENPIKQYSAQIYGEKSGCALYGVHLHPFPLLASDFQVFICDLQFVMCLIHFSNSNS